VFIVTSATNDDKSSPGLSYVHYKHENYWLSFYIQSFVVSSDGLRCQRVSREGVPERELRRLETVAFVGAIEFFVYVCVYMYV